MEWFLKHIHVLKIHRDEDCLEMAEPCFSVGMIYEKMDKFEPLFKASIVEEVDKRLQEITTAFVQENKGMKGEIDKLKEVMEAIGGEKFQEVSQAL